MVLSANEIGRYHRCGIGKIGLVGLGSGHLCNLNVAPVAQLQRDKAWNSRVHYPVAGNLQRLVDLELVSFVVDHCGERAPRLRAAGWRAGSP
jgi:hypothetical protein